MYTNTCCSTIFGENITTNSTDVNKTNAHKIYAHLFLLTSVLFQRKSDVCQKYRYRQLASIRCFFYTRKAVTCSVVYCYTYAFDNENEILLQARNAHVDIYL